MITWTRFSYINKICLVLYSKGVGAKIHLGKNISIGKGVSFTLKRHSELVLHDSVIISSLSDIRVYENSTMSLGRNTKIDTGVRLISANGKKVITGQNVKIGLNCVLNGGGGIDIGENSSLYGNVYIRSSNHVVNGQGLFEKNSYEHKKIVIDKNSLILPFSDICF
jgi:acetyltransferase-like isoleucine patch superfamily enzyme